MSVLYNPGKANVVANALSRLSMGSVAHIEDENKKLIREVHQLAILGVRLVNLAEGNILIQNSSKSSLIAEVKEKQDSDPIFLRLKKVIQSPKVKVFSQGEDDVLRCQGRLYSGCR